MKKNLLNEINQIKFMFGYKAGKVLSEQEENDDSNFREPVEPVSNDNPPMPPAYSNSIEPTSDKGKIGSALSLYKVKPGDNLTKIAKDMGVTVDDILKRNPQIKDKNKIYPGDIITIEKF